MSYTMNLTLTLNHPDNPPMIFPISRGPHAGYDVIYVESDLVGKYNVKRMDLAGNLVNDYGKVDNAEESIALIAKLKKEQAIKNYDTITGGGRWSCD